MNDIEQLLPKDIYDAATGAALPSASNVFATIADVTAAAQNLQSVMDNGSTATGLTTAVQIDTSVEISFLADSGSTQGQIYATPAQVSLGKSNGADINAFVMTDAATTFTDDINSKGIVYGTDYSAAGTLDDRWVPDYGAVKSYADGLVGAYLPLAGGTMDAAGTILGSGGNVGLHLDGSAYGGGANEGLWSEDVGTYEKGYVGFNIAGGAETQIGYDLSNGEVFSAWEKIALNNSRIKNQTSLHGYTIVDVGDAASTLFAGGLQIVGKNILADYIWTPGTGSSANVSVGSQSTTFKQNVQNAVALAGKNIVMKTNYVAYVDRLAFNTGGAFETRIEHTTTTLSDKIAILQDRTGTISYIDQIGGKNVNALITNPLVGQDGYVVSWDNTAGQYTLVPVTGGDGNGMFDASNNATAWAVTAATLGGATTLTGAANNLIFNATTGRFRVENSGFGGFVETYVNAANQGVLNITGNILGRGASGNWYMQGVNASGLLLDGSAGDGRFAHMRTSNGGTIGGNHLAAGGIYVINFSHKAPGNALNGEVRYDFRQTNGKTGNIIQIENTSGVATSAITHDGRFGIGTVSVTAGAVLETNTGNVIYKGASLNTEFFFDYSANNLTIGDNTSRVGKLNVIGQSVMHDNGINTLLLGDDLVGGGAVRSGIVFNDVSYVNPSRIYDRSDGTFNNGLTLKSRNNVFHFLSSADSTATSEIYVGNISQVRTIKGVTNSKLVIQGGTAPNDADDGVVIQTADNLNVMQNRLNIQADAANVNAYLHNINGFHVGGTSAPTSMLTVTGDVETLGNGNGVIVADATTGTRYRIYMDNGVLMTQLA